MCAVQFILLCSFIFRRKLDHSLTHQPTFVSTNTQTFSLRSAHTYHSYPLLTSSSPASSQSTNSSSPASAPCHTHMSHDATDAPCRTRKQALQQPRRAATPCPKFLPPAYQLLSQALQRSRRFWPCQWNCRRQSSNT